MVSKLFKVALAAVLSAGQADAALFVSGDMNILPLFNTDVPNFNFFKNIVDGSNVVIHVGTDPLYSALPTLTINLYNNAGYNASILASATTISSAHLAGVDLFISYGPGDNYTAGEVAALSAFMNGGGNLFLLGENSSVPDITGRVNQLLIDLGSSMRIVPDLLDAGPHTAQLQDPSPYLANTTGLVFGATSRVTGGYGLFGTQNGNITFVAGEGLGGPVGGVPEPASWAMLIAGFGLTGAAMRRRRSVSAI